MGVNINVASWTIYATLTTLKLLFFGGYNLMECWCMEK